MVQVYIHHVLSILLLLLLHHHLDFDYLRWWVMKLDYLLLVMMMMMVVVVVVVVANVMFRMVEKVDNIVMEDRHNYVAYQDDDPVDLEDASDETMDRRNVVVDVDVDVDVDRVVDVVHNIVVGNSLPWVNCLFLFFFWRVYVIDSLI